MKKRTFFDRLPDEVRDFVRADSYKSEDVLYYPTFFFPSKNITAVHDIACDALMRRIKPYYRQRELESDNSPYNFLVEPLKNANFHSDSENSMIRFDLVLTPLVLAASYNDEGSYFRRQEVKEAWENKIVLPEKHKVDSKQVGYGAGTGFIYDLADLIHVDTDSGTLYIGMMAKKFCS